MARAAVADGGTPSPNWRGGRYRGCVGQGSDGEKRRIGLEENLDKQEMMVETLVQAEGLVGRRSPRWHAGGGDVGSGEVCFIWGI